jgi:hypothetical protein
MNLPKRRLTQATGNISRYRHKTAKQACHYGGILRASAPSNPIEIVYEPRDGKSNAAGGSSDESVALRMLYERHRHHVCVLRDERQVLDVLERQSWQRGVRSRQVDALLGLKFRRAFGNPGDLDPQTVLSDIANHPRDLAIVQEDRLADAHAAEHFSERTRYERRFGHPTVVAVDCITTGSLPMHDVQGIATPWLARPSRIALETSPSVGCLVLIAQFQKLPATNVVLGIDRFCRWPLYSSEFEHRRRSRVD